jgi:peptide/nickel transport system permease protein
MAEGQVLLRETTRAERLRGHPRLLAGLALCSVLLLACIASLLQSPDPLLATDLTRRLQGPGAGHWLGTDALGRDLAPLLMGGARNAVGVGLIALGISLGLGLPLGLLSAARSGWIDRLIGRITDLGQAFPALLLAILMAASLGPGMGVAMLAIGLHGVPACVRLVRAAAQVQWQRDYVRAARAFGRSEWQIARVHVLPNIASPLLVLASNQFALALLAEASLAYLGLGTQAPAPSWGRMLAEAQTWLFEAPQLALLPGLCLMGSVLGLQLLADGLRDWLAPRR